MNGRSQNLQTRFPPRTMPPSSTGARRIEPRRPTVRRGMVLVVVIVSLVVVLATLMALLRLAMSHREAVESEGRRLQAGWLARSGAERAVARLAADAKYSGETWNIAAVDLGRPVDLGTGDTARVEIRIEAVAGQPQRRTVRVQADFPAQSVGRARTTWQHDVDLPPAAVKPVEKPTGKPVEKPTGKPASVPAASVATPGGKPETKPIPVPPSKPAEKTSTKR